ncbi:unnamed protein product [Arctogadus glacialis]
MNLCFQHPVASGPTKGSSTCITQGRHGEDQMLFYSGTLLLPLTFISLVGGRCSGEMACPVETLWEHKGNMQSHPPIEFCFVLFPQERVVRDDCG